MISVIAVLPNKDRQMWTSGIPTTEGWYFWKKRRNTTDPWLWFAYYVTDDRGDDETTDNFSCWAEGTAVHWPKGGWWMSIVIPVPDIQAKPDE